MLPNTLNNKNKRYNMFLLPAFIILALVAGCLAVAPANADYLCPACGGGLVSQASSEPVFFCGTCQRTYELEELAGQPSQNVENESTCENCIICSEENITLLHWPCCTFASCRDCSLKLISDPGSCPGCRTSLTDLSPRLLCPHRGCGFSSASHQEIWEHMKVHGPALFSADDMPGYGFMMINRLLSCTECRLGIAIVAPHNDGGELIISHVDTCHRTYHCSLCRETALFKGRDAVLQHLLENHCLRLCHFPGCGYQPGAPDADELHMSEAHVQYQIFMYELYGSQEQGSTTVEGEPGEPVDKPDDQDDNHTDESDNEYGEAPAVELRRRSPCESAGGLVMENSCLKAKSQCLSAKHREALRMNQPVSELPKVVLSVVG